MYHGLLLAQQSVLPVDWRQHNITKYNDNVFNPALSFVHNDQMNLSLWGRIQWASIDDAPRTYFINYSGRSSGKSGGGLALFQHNIGLFTDSGLMVNYARGIQLAQDTWLTFGVNIIGSRRGLNEANFITPEPDPAILEGKDDFIVTLMPGINLTLNNFNVGISAENLLDYNISDSSGQTEFADKIFMGFTSYDFKFEGRSRFWDNSILRATTYAKIIPDQDLQYGVRALMDLPEIGWIQAGYNNFYGIAGGIGAKVSKGVAVGFLIETGTQNSNQAFGATYEITAAIEFGKIEAPKKQLAINQKPKPKRRRKITPKEEVVSDVELVQIPNDSLNANSKLPEPKPVTVTESDKQKPRVIKDTLGGKVSEIEVFSGDEIVDVTLESEAVNKVKDSTKISGVTNSEDDAVLKKLFNDESQNAVYRTIKGIEGMEPGFYLIINVFSQKKYYELFVRLLKTEGLNPKSFYNPENSYYYVYLDKYENVSEAEKDRRSNFDGRYKGDTWILWIQKD